MNKTAAISANSQTFTGPSLLLLLLLAIFALSPVRASTPQSAESVSIGTVTLSLGKAWIESPQRKREQVRQGMAVRVQDRIETLGNAHIHIQMVDDAGVSVRPNSRLTIVRYQYDAANPEASVVKFSLEEGVARSMSGEAAKHAKQNFRLNTPIAAIGVRGTDFVVSSSSQTVRALVTEGAIVMAAFSDTCSADTYGPCSQNAMELASGESRILELNANSLQPVLLPLPGAEIPTELLDSSIPMVAETGRTEHEEDGGNDIYTDSVTTLAVNQKIAGTKELIVSPGTNPGTVVPEPQVDFTPEVRVDTAELVANTQLVWGRWSENRSQINERITVSFEEALAGGRSSTVGNNLYALYRPEEGSLRVQPGLGVVAFNLSQAQATFNDGGGRELMEVYGGLLNIDFDADRFSTSLDLGHASTGNVQFTDSGRLFSGGYFRNRTDDKSTAGAVSLDGTEAGYLFEQQLQSGKIEGITLWKSGP